MAQAPLAIAAQLGPEGGPGLAWLAAEEDLLVALALLVLDPVGVAHPARQVAAEEEAVQVVALEADHNERFRGRVAVTAQPVAVHPADGPWQPILWAVEI